MEVTCLPVGRKSSMDFDAGKHELNHKGCCREACLKEAECGTTARGAGSAYEATLSRREDA